MCIVQHRVPVQCAARVCARALRTYARKRIADGIARRHLMLHARGAARAAPPQCAGTRFSSMPAQSSGQAGVE